MSQVGVNYEPLHERLMFGYDGSDYRVVKIDTDGNLVVALKTTEDVQANAYGWVAGAWQKNPLLLGYSDRRAEQKSNLSAAAGFDVLSGTAVPSGEVWVITAVSAYDVNTSVTNIGLVASLGGVPVYLTLKAPGAANIPVAWSGQVVLKEGDIIQAAFFGTVLNDDIYLAYAGYQVDIDQ